MWEKIAYIGLFAILLFLSGFALAHEDDISTVSVEPTVIDSGIDNGVTITATSTTETNSDETDEALVNAHSKALEARIDKVTLGYEKTLAAMDTIIERAKELNASTETMEELKVNFTSTFEELDMFVTNVDPSGFGKTVAEMHKIAARFKKAAHVAIKEEHRDSVKEKIRERKELKEMEEKYKEVKERAMKRAKEFYGFACLENKKRAETAIRKAKMENVTLNLTEIKERLRESCDKINETKNETEYEEKVKKIKEVFTNTGKKVREAAKKIDTKGIEKAVSVISILKTSGKNVTTAENKLQTLKARYDNLKEKCKEAETDECKEEFKKLRMEIEKTGLELRKINAEVRKEMFNSNITDVIPGDKVREAVRSAVRK